MGRECLFGRGDVQRKGRLSQQILCKLRIPEVRSHRFLGKKNGHAVVKGTHGVVGSGGEDGKLPAVLGRTPDAAQIKQGRGHVIISSATLEKSIDNILTKV